MEATLARNGTVTDAEAKAIANYINVATGRGHALLGEQAAPGLATIFFAPRYTMSRFQLLAGQPLLGGSVRTRGLIAKEYAKYLTGVGVALGLGALAGGEIETDPRSSDFGKIKFGNRRINLLSGLSQATTLVSRAATGQTKTASGEIRDLVGDKVKFGQGNLQDTLARFARTKLSPAFGTALDLRLGKNVVGEKVTPGSALAQLAVPLSLRDIYDSMKDNDVPEGMAMAALSLFGANIQNYDAAKKHSH